MRLYNFVVVLIFSCFILNEQALAETHNSYSSSIQSISESVAVKIKKNSGFSFFTKTIEIEFPELEQAYNWNVFYDKLDTSLKEAFIRSGFNLAIANRETNECEKTESVPDFIAQINVNIYGKTKQIKIIATVREIVDNTVEKSFIVTVDLPIQHFNAALKDISTTYIPQHVKQGGRINPFTEIDAVCRSIAKSFKCKLHPASVAWNTIYRSTNGKPVEFELLHYRFLGLAPNQTVEPILADKITHRLYNQLCKTGLSINAGFGDIESVLDQIEMYQDLPSIYKNDPTAAKIQLIPSQVIILGDISKDNIRQNQYIISLRAAVTASDLQGIASQGFMVPQLVVDRYYNDGIAALEKTMQYRLVYKADIPFCIPEEKTIVQRIKNDLKMHLGNSKIELVEKPGNLLGNYGTIEFSISLSTPDLVTNKYSISMVSFLLKLGGSVKGSSQEVVVNKTEKLIFKTGEEINEHKLYNLLKKMVPVASKGFLDKL